MERDGAGLLGTAVRPAFGGRFPILVKFLFTQEKLSVQVHPDDAYGEEHEGSPGKTEMWYVVNAPPGAEILLNLNSHETLDSFRRAVAAGGGLRLRFVAEGQAEADSEPARGECRTDHELAARQAAGVMCSDSRRL